MLTTGLRVPGVKKVFATEFQAYYAIAKRLVVAKYPPPLLDEDRDYPVDGLADVWRDVRIDKGRRLFYADREQHFDTQRWVAFLRRVVKLLRFVDKRRGSPGMLRDLHTGLLPAEEAALLEQTFQSTTAGAEKLMELADGVRAEIRRRAEVDRG